MFNSKINVISNNREKGFTRKKRLYKYTKDVSSIIASLPLTGFESFLGVKSQRK